MNTVSKRLKLSVANILQQAEGPLRTSEVAEILGKSHTSINSALRAIGAVQVEGMYPAEWIISEDGLAPVTAITSTTPRVGASRGQDFLVSSPEMEPAQFVATWNEHHKAFGKRISALSIDENADPKDLVDQLASLAGAIAGLAAALDEVKGRPDWLDALS